MNIADIRKQYPQYGDLSDEQLGKALHAKFYSDMPFADFSQKVGLSAPAPQPEEPSYAARIARQLGLTGRAAVGGVLALPAMLGDAVTGGKSTPAVKTVLDAVFPQPRGFENVVQDVAGSMIPAAGMAKATGTASTMLPQILSAAGGAAGAGTAREMDIGPLGQTIAAIGAGVVAPSMATAAAEGGKAALRAGRGMIEPFSEQGRRTIAARTMQANATDPRAAAANIQTAPEYIPGQQPTTAELAQDSGLSGLQKSIRNRFPADFADRAAVQDQARQTYLQRAFGGQPELDAAMAAREAATAPLREQALSAANQTGEQAQALEAAIRQKAQSKVGALQNSGQMQTSAAQQQVLADNWTPVPGMPRVPGHYSPNIERVPEYAAGAQEAAKIAAQREAERRVLQTSLEAMPYAPLKSGPIVASIEQSLSQPGQRSSDVVSKTLSTVAEKIAGVTSKDGIVDARDLYTIRKELGNTIETFAKESNNWDKRLAAGLERDLQRKIDNAILKAGGVEWPQYLRQYSDLSQKIEALKLGQEITAAARNPLTERLSPAQFTRQFENRAEEIAKAGPQTSDVLSRVAADVRRATAPEAAMRTPGSDTAQNVLGANLMRRTGLSSSPSRAIMGLIGKAYGPLEEQTQGLILKGLLDPKEGAALLTQQLSKDPKALDELLRRLMVIPGAGLLGGGIAQ